MIPDNVEKIIMTRESYDRNIEQLLVEKLELQQRIDKAIKTIELWDMCGSELITTFQEEAIKILKGEDNNAI